MKAAIIGFGTVSKAHYAALKKAGIDVVAIYSGHLAGEEKARVEAEYRVKVYSDYAALLAEPEIGLVSICSRPDLHAEQAIQAAKAGKHIILEKPIAIKFEDALRVAQAAVQNGVALSVCLECRYSDQYLKSKELVKRIGKISACSTGYYHNIGPNNPQYPWNTSKASGGSSLLSAGCHALDFALGLMGDQPVLSVYARAAKNAPDSEYQYPTRVEVQLALANGVPVTVTSDIACKKPYTFDVEVSGNQGVLCGNQLCVEGEDGKLEWKTVPMAMLTSGDVHDHPYAKQFAHFKSQIEGLDIAGVNRNLAAALYTHQVVDAAERSLKLGRPVEVSPPAKLIGRSKPKASDLSITMHAGSLIPDLGAKPVRKCKL